VVDCGPVSTAAVHRRHVRDIPRSEYASSSTSSIDAGRDIPGVGERTSSRPGTFAKRPFTRSNAAKRLSSNLGLLKLRRRSALTLRQNSASLTIPQPRSRHRRRQRSARHRAARRVIPATRCSITSRVTSVTRRASAWPTRGRPVSCWRSMVLPHRGSDRAARHNAKQALVLNFPTNRPAAR